MILENWRKLARLKDGKVLAPGKINALQQKRYTFILEAMADDCKYTNISFMWQKDLIINFHNEKLQVI